MGAILAQACLFGAASAVVIVAPGPDNLATLSIGVSKGKHQAMGFGAGCAIGCFTHTLWAALGVTALLAASAAAFTTMKILGAGYLFYLGILSLKSAGVGVSGETAVEPTVGKYLVRGFVANAVNPKVAMFFLAFLPQFVVTGPNATMQIALMGACFAVMSGAAFVSLGYFSGEVGDWLKRRPALSRRLGQMTGILFIGLGVRLLFQRH